MAAYISVSIALLFGVLSGSERVSNIHLIQLSDESNETETSKSEKDDEMMKLSGSGPNPMERAFGPHVSEILAHWSSARFNDQPISETREGPSVKLTFRIAEGLLGNPEIPEFAKGECLRKCKVKTGEVLCNGDGNIKNLNVFREQKHAVSRATHTSPVGKYEYTLCCEVVQCEDDAWKVNYDVFSPMIKYNPSMDSIRDMCVCCTEALPSKVTGSYMANHCGAAFTPFTFITSLDEKWEGIDGVVKMRVADSVWEEECQTVCSHDATRKFAYPKTQLTIS